MQVEMESRVAALTAHLDAELHNTVRRGSAPLRDVCAHLLPHGSRIRSRLLMAALGEVDENSYCQTLHASCALELLHTATLIQDDIFDQAHTRRGRTTTHLAYGAPLATLASDWLLLEATRLSAKVSPAFAELLSRAAQAMTMAEALELCPPKLVSTTQAWRYLREVAVGKTGSLFAAAIAGAAVIQEDHAMQIERSWEIGCELGVTFQLIDDGKDLLSTSEHVGKDVRQDLLARRLTMPLLMTCAEVSGPDQSLARLHALLQCELSAKQDDDFYGLRPDIVKEVLARELTLRRDQHLSAIYAAGLPTSLTALVEQLCRFSF